MGKANKSTMKSSKNNHEASSSISFMKSMASAIFFFIMGLVTPPSLRSTSLFTGGTSAWMAMNRILASHKITSKNVESLSDSLVVTLNETESEENQLHKNLQKEEQQQQQEQQDDNVGYASCTEENLANFIHEHYVKGYHIICLQEPHQNINNDHENQEPNWNITVYESGTKTNERKRSAPISTLKEFKDTVDNMITSSNPLMSRSALFTPDGIHIQNLALAEHLSQENGMKQWKHIQSYRMMILIEGGTWFWPGVRVGFKRTISLDQYITTSTYESETPRLATLETLSVIPLVLSVQDFVSLEESNYMQHIAAPRVKRASSVSLKDDDIGKAASNWRTSQSTFITSTGDDLLTELEHRVSKLTRVPKNHQEAYQILKYDIGQKYDAHLDYFEVNTYQKDKSILQLTKNGKRNRFATVFLYLSEVEKGGETIFPRFNKGRRPRDNADCTKGLKVKPESGKVIIFYSLMPTGEYDPYSLHGACPVDEGVKWAGNKWIWNAPMHFVPL